MAPVCCSIVVRVIHTVRSKQTQQQYLRITYIHYLNHKYFIVSTYPIQVLVPTCFNLLLYLQYNYYNYPISIFQILCKFLLKGYGYG